MSGDNVVSALLTYTDTFPRMCADRLRLKIMFSIFFLRFVYWTDWGDKAFIGRVGMDGVNKVPIITTKIEWPNGITIDYTNDKLYWSDAHLGYIE